MRDIKRAYSAVLTDSLFKKIEERDGYFLYKSKYSYAFLKRKRININGELYSIGSIIFKKDINLQIIDCEIIFQQLTNGLIILMANDYTEDNTYKGIIEKIQKKTLQITQQHKHRL